MLDVVGAGLLGRITDDAVRALKRTHGQPWVSTIAADSRGDSLCAQIQVLPNVTDEFAERRPRQDRGQWTPLTSRFCPGEIAKASGLEVVELNGG